MKIWKEGQSFGKRGKQLEVDVLVCTHNFFLHLNWHSKESCMMWEITVAFQMFPTLSPILPIYPFPSSFLTASFIHCSLYSSFFFPFLSALSSGSCFPKLSSDNKPLVWWFHLFLDTHNLFWMGLWRETQIELTTLFRSCWMQALVLKIKFQWRVSFEQSAKEFRIISVTRRRKFYSPVFLRKALYAFGRITLINHFGWGLNSQSMLTYKRCPLNCLGRRVGPITWGVLCFAEFSD